MEQSYIDWSRGGTAPTQQQPIKEQQKRASAISSSFTSSSSTNSNNVPSMVSSPIRSKPQPARPKTSSTADISDLNISFRANRSMAANQKLLQNEYTIGDGSEQDSNAEFRRLQKEVEYAKSVDDIRFSGYSFPDENPAARNAWGSRQGSSPNPNRGVNEKDVTSSKHKKGLVAYLQSPAPVLSQQQRSSSGRLVSGTQQIDDEPSSAPSSQRTSSNRDTASAQSKNRLSTPNSQRPRNPYQTAASNASNVDTASKPKKSGLYGSVGIKKPASSTNSGSVGNNYNSSNSAFSTTGNSNSSSRSKLMNDQIPLDKSAAIAYLGGAPPVLRSSSTRSRVRLHVNVANSLQSTATDSSLDNSNAVQARPQTHHVDSSTHLPSESQTEYLAKGNLVGAQNIDHGEDETIEEILEYYEEAHAPNSSTDSGALFLATIRNNGSSSPTRSRSPSSNTMAISTSASPFSSSNMMPDTWESSPSKVLSLTRQRASPPREVVYIGHHDMEANRKLERPTSRKPYLGASSVTSDESANKAHPLSAGARLHSSTSESVRVGPAFKLKRAESFGSGISHSSSSKSFRETKSERPPSRQSSAFPVNLAEPQPDIAIMQYKNAGIEDWDSMKQQKTSAADRKNAMTRKSGQPVDLDELDSDDEIFNHRNSKQRSASRSVPHGSDPGNSKSGVPKDADHSVVSSKYSAIVQPLQMQYQGAPSPTPSVSSARRMPVSARRGSQSSRRGSDPVADGFTALGVHDDNSWPFSIKINYGGGTTATDSHVPRHILEMETNLLQRNSVDDSVEDEDDDLSELELIASGSARSISISPRGNSTVSSSKSSRIGRASPVVISTAAGWDGVKLRGSPDEVDESTHRSNPRKDGHIGIVPWSKGSKAVSSSQSLVLCIVHHNSRIWKSSGLWAMKL